MPAYGIEQLGKAAKGCTEVVSAAGTWHALMRSAPDFSGWASETRALCMPQHTGARGQVTHVCNTCGVQCVCVQELDAILSFFRKSFSRQYDNAYYTGEFSAGGEREGQGILEFENGQRFSFLGSRAKPCCALLESSKWDCLAPCGASAGCAPCSKLTSCVAGVHLLVHVRDSMTGMKGSGKKTNSMAMEPIF